MARSDPGEGKISFLERLLITAISAIVTAVILFVLAIVAMLWAVNASGPQAREGAVTVVELSSGAGLNKIANQLEASGVIWSGPLFVITARVTGATRSLKAGEYEFASGASLSSVLDKIVSGQVARHQVTIPEGVTVERAVEILMAEPVLTGAAPVPVEGTILPDTYDVRRGEDRGVVLERMISARDRLLEQLWAQRSEGLPFSSPEEAVVLASIVEKETAKPEERPMIARVFINRLQTGMRLQSDPTIIYGLTRGRPLGRGIRKSEIQAPTPYNTYAIAGLPPTPIANPGREALAAVLSPPAGNWLFFVADGTGGHVFASTLEDHERNVARWRQIERQNSQSPAP